MPRFPEAPSRSHPRPVDNPGLHQHRDNSSGGRISAVDLLDIPALTATQDHGLLLGLGDDDHSQYLLLAGRTTGQLAYGGTASGADLTLSSTAHASKGFIYFGSDQTSGFDEFYERLGIRTATPDAPLHVVGAPSTGLVQASDDISRDVGFIEPVGASELWQCLLTLDATAYVTADFPASRTTTAVMETGALSTSSASYTVNYQAYKTGTITNGASYVFTVFGADGIGYRCAPIVIDSTYTLTVALYSVVCSIAAGTSTANRLRIDVTIPFFSSFAIVWDYLEIDTGGGEVAVEIVERTDSGSSPFSIWRNASAVTVASVTSSGAGKFQNLILEDPGAGTGTVTLIAPTGATSYSLTLPADDGNASEVLITNGAGVLDWVAASTLTGIAGTIVDHEFIANGDYIADTSVDGAFVAKHAFTITKTTLWRRVAGSSGTTTVVLKQNGSTIDTRNVTTANGSNFADTSGVLALAVASGDKLTIDATAVEAGSPLDYVFGFEGA